MNLLQRPWSCNWHVMSRCGSKDHVLSVLKLNTWQQGLNTPAHDALEGPGFHTGSAHSHWVHLTEDPLCQMTAAIGACEQLLPLLSSLLQLPCTFEGKDSPGWEFVCRDQGNSDLIMPLPRCSPNPKPSLPYMHIHKGWPHPYSVNGS